MTQGIKNFLVAFYACLSISHVSPSLIRRRQDDRCADLLQCDVKHALENQGLQAECYNCLSVPQWLRDYQANITTCSPSDNSKHCCRPEEVWANCFIRILNSQEASSTFGNASCDTADLMPARYCQQDFRSFAASNYIRNDNLTEAWAVAASIVGTDPYYPLEPYLRYGYGHC